MSQLEGTSEVIDGKTFEVYKLPPKISKRCLIRVLNMLGPAGPEIAKAIDQVDDAKPLEGQISKFGGALGALMQHADADILESVEAELAKVTTVDGVGLTKGAKYEEVFANDIGLSFKWMFFAMKVQWGNLFGPIGDLIAARPDKKDDPQPSPDTSSGTG